MQHVAKKTVALRSVPDHSKGMHYELSIVKWDERGSEIVDEYRAGSNAATLEGAREDANATSRELGRDFTVTVVRGVELTHYRYRNGQDW